MKDRDSILSNVAYNVVRLRKLKGLSQEQLSFDANVPRSQISLIEKGNSNFTLDTICRISNALQVHPCDLMLSGNN